MIGRSLKWRVGIALSVFLAGCGADGVERKAPKHGEYAYHRSITSSVFWAGEEAGEENGGIANHASVWDDLWMWDYGGVDDPDRRDGYRPAAFVPYENPFYVALPFNDFDENGSKKPGLSDIIPWAGAHAVSPEESLCKNRWIEIEKDGRKAYAQWEDAGPFGENDAAYVFGDALPSNPLNDHAGIDVSPAVRDYLRLQDLDKVDWRFVEASEVPDGPWKRIVTRSTVRWIDPDLHIPAGSSWNWQLQGELNTTVQARYYDIDLFDTDAQLIARLHQLGHRVLCYFSAGTWENWREDAGRFPQDALGRPLEDWPGERWLDIRRDDVRRLMIRRLQRAREKGCDGVEPDNVDAYAHSSGFKLEERDQILYNRFIATQAHALGLSVGLKNDPQQAQELQPYFDFALSEECHRYGECDRFMTFVREGKAVFNVEYDERYRRNEHGERDRLCDDARVRGFATLILPLELDGSFRFACP